ncbi:unnamed protein product [Linum trigynum]|uniref:Gag-pol polyprotein n=1 Tax=Linum trigynum TaxID=586398 RepID=A0AAV2F3W5_9ROSI
MEAFQKDLNDIKRRVIGLEEVKEDVSTILRILSKIERTMEAKNGDAPFGKEILYQPHNKVTSNDKTPLLLSKNVHDAEQSKCDNPRRSERLEERVICIGQGKLENHEMDERANQRVRNKGKLLSTQVEAEENIWKCHFQKNHALSYVATTTPILRPLNFVTPANQIPLPVPQQGVNRDVTMPRKAKRVFDPIPITYTELFPQLLHERLIAPIPGEALRPPYPRWYRFDKQCDYHSGVQGHSVENCNAMKIRIQEMVKAGWLKFEEEPKRPDVNRDSLPTHEN